MIVVILCAGRGQRLSSVLPPGVNKCAVDINGIPFIRLLIDHMRGWGLGRFILCAGYGADSITNAVKGIRGVGVIDCGPESKGTARTLLDIGDRSSPLIVVNGDTWIDLDRYDWREIVKRLRKLETAILFGHNDRNCGLRWIKHPVKTLPWLESYTRKNPNVGIDDALLLAGAERVNTVVDWIDIGTPERLDQFRKEWLKGKGRIWQTDSIG